MSIHAVITELVLRCVYGVAETLRTFAPFAKLAHRVLRALIGLHHVRGAIDEAGSWKSLAQQFGLRTPVIAYHNVGVPRADEYPGLTTPVPEFEAQIKLLSKMGYTAITPADWLRWRDEGMALPEKPVMLVFDDAYEEAAAHALPLLQRYGFRAACMVVTSCIGTTNRWDEEAGRPSFQLMRATQIVEWSQKGIEFGGHTSRHPELPYENDEVVEQEIAQCKKDLTTLLGKPPSSFAYPFGGFSAAAEAAVRRHFQLGFTSWPGRLHLATNPCLVPRIAFLPGESKFGIWCRLRFGRNPFEVLRNRLRKLTGTSSSKSYAAHAQPAGDQR
jgi:peptidoglycan/xylan/chitin deacetylase (PgdA/CDA1 family)